MKLPSRIKSTVVITALAALAIVYAVRAAETPSAVAAGQRVIPFHAKTTAATDVSFPGDYKGKVVLLDFWATWCGPCVAELPNVTAAYDKYHAKGFEILSVSLDQENMAAKLAAFTKANKMSWPEIYDGKYWKATIAVQYKIEYIPHAFLVNGDTGMILADGDSIRGDNLAPAIEKALAGLKAK